MDIKQKLQEMIDKAWQDYNELLEAEIETGYDDAMDGFERKEAEGYALGLEAAYLVFFNEPSASNIEIVDQYGEE
jgi:hypothetical protein